MFVEETYEYVAKFLEASLAELQTRHENIVGKFRRVNSNHFTATVYRNGKSVTPVRDSAGGGLGSNQIVYSNDPNSTNSMNEGVGVAEDGQTMLLKAIGLSSMMSERGKEKDRLTPARRSGNVLGVADRTASAIIAFVAPQRGGCDDRQRAGPVAI